MGTVHRRKKMIRSFIRPSLRSSVVARRALHSSAPLRAYRKPEDERTVDERVPTKSLRDDSKLIAEEAHLVDTKEASGIEENMPATDAATTNAPPGLLKKLNLQMNGLLRTLIPISLLV